MTDTSTSEESQSSTSTPFVSPDRCNIITPHPASCTFVRRQGCKARQYFSTSSSSSCMLQLYLRVGAQIAKPTAEGRSAANLQR